MLSYNQNQTKGWERNVEWEGTNEKVFSIQYSTLWVRSVGQITVLASLQIIEIDYILLPLHAYCSFSSNWTIL